MEMIRQEPPASLTMSIGDAMFTQRAIRRLDPSRPISDEHIKVILDAASKAPNGGNTQPSRYLVIRDRNQISEFGKLYKEAWWAKRRDEYGWTGPSDIPEDSLYRLPSLLAEEMKDAPAVVLVFSKPSHVAASSTFPGVQNLLLAARALGIGSVLTTLHPDVMDRVYAMYGIPEEITFHCCIPLGYPRGRFGPTSRLPTSVTAFFGRWDSPPPWA